MNKPAKIALGGLAAAVILSAAALLIPREEAAVAVIKQNGKHLRTIDLSAVTVRQSFPIEGENGCSNTVEVEPGRIRILKADCPDQICVNQGWISDSSVPIVCLPNKLVIEIIGGEDAFDAVTK